MNRFAGLPISASAAIGYGYNAAGQLASLALPSGKMITYGYNANGQVTSVTLNGSPNVTILSNVTYDPFGPITGWTWGNSTTASRTFDTDGKLTQVTSSGQRSFGYDDAFRITAANDVTTPANSWTLGYDILDRLNSATKPSTTIGYTYDADGNRLTQAGTSASTYTIPGTSNKLSSVTGVLARTYTYDAVGNALTTGVTTHTYNNRGRMKTGKLNAATPTTYIHNALGQRIKKSGGPQVTTVFMYDEAGHLVGEYTISAGAAVRVQETVWLGDIPVATLRTNGANVDVFYVHTDQINTPRKVSRPSDNKLRWSWDPTPFGEGAPNENPSVPALGVFKYNLRFPGQYFDVETNLNYNYFRDYDPAIGRYVQSDPIGLYGGMNTFAYVGGNPLSRIDIYGLWWLGDPLPASVVNVAAGFGDGVSSVLTFGLYSTSDVRRAFGIDGGVDECASSYASSKYSGYAWGAATLWAAGLNGGANSAFWAGRGASAEAAALGTTIGGTPIGAILTAAGVESRLVWGAASATFAANASRAVAVIRYVAPNSLWRVEQAIREARRVAITYH